MARTPSPIHDSKIRVQLQFQFVFFKANQHLEENEMADAIPDIRPDYDEPNYDKAKIARMFWKIR